MSFQNQGFWMAKGSESFNDGDMTGDSSSKIEPKRSHQWFMNCPEADSFPNKKQAAEVPNNNLFSGIFNSNVPTWGNASVFPSIASQFTERLFDAEKTKTVNFHDRNNPSISSGKTNAGKSFNEDLFGGDPSFSLSMSHTVEDAGPALNYGGIRKVKVNQVRDSDNPMLSSAGDTYDRVDNNPLSASHSYSKMDENCISMGLAYRGDENMMSLAGAYDRDNGFFISSGQSSKVDENIISMRQTYAKHSESPATGCNIYEKENSHSLPRDDTYGRGVNCLSIGLSHDKMQSTIISFGGCNDDDDPNTSGRTLPNYEFLMGQASSQGSEIPNDKDLVEASVDALGGRAMISSTEGTKKREEPKASRKVQNNSFPSNVRSLLSTGILDGVPVKYIAWSREKELRAVIKGSGYQCGCQSCNFSKVVNAYEFERHAGCKTKHPNNHIYFENGKTIYGIVQELRNTPQNILFDVIQTITGSPINMKSFRLWKESFLAATRELQRIYGKEEGHQLL